MLWWALAIPSCERWHYLQDLRERERQRERARERERERERNVHVFVCEGVEDDDDLFCCFLIETTRNQVPYTIKWCSFRLLIICP